MADTHVSKTASDTKSRLLHAAIKAFGQHGFLGASVREIAREAGTNPAAIKYHFESKEKLWREVVRHLQLKLVDSLFVDEQEWPSMSPRERVLNTTRRYVEFYAHNPALQRIVMFETIQGGERMEWLVEHHFSRFTDGSIAWVQLAQDEGVFPEDLSPLQLHMIMIGAAQNIFLMAPHIKQSRGLDVFSDAEIDKHIKAITAMVVGLGAEAQAAGMAKTLQNQDME